jgi:hypothetical protein
MTHIAEICPLTMPTSMCGAKLYIVKIPFHVALGAIHDWGTKNECVTVKALK